jgi:hypothetical protein
MMALKNITLRKGGRRDLGIQTNFDILLKDTDFVNLLYRLGGFYSNNIYYGTSRPFHGSTTPQDEAYIILPGQGVGIIGVLPSDTPDLTAVIEGTPRGYDQLQDLSASWTAMQSGSTQPLVVSYVPLPGGGIGIINSTSSPDLSASISPLLIYKGDLDLEAYYNPLMTSGEGLMASYRGYESGFDVVSGIIDPQAEAYLLSFYRATTESGDGLSGFIEPIPPLDFTAYWLGVTGVDLPASIDPILPEELFATVTGYSFHDLTGDISGWDDTSITGSYHAYQQEQLAASLYGIASGTADLQAALEGFKGVLQQAQLRSVWIGNGELGIWADIEGYEPATFDAEIEGYEPSELAAEIIGKHQGVPISGTISGALPPHSIVAEITPQGGHADLKSYLFKTDQSDETLYATIGGFGSDQLTATLGVVPQDLLGATISGGGYVDPSTMAGFYAYLEAAHNLDLTAEYTTKEGATLGAYIDSIDPADLYAAITPKVFYVDSSIPINTFPFKDVKALINASPCGYDSFFSDLGVYIKGVSSSDLTASVVGLRGQYAIAQDELTLYRKNKVLDEDWIFLIADQPAVSETVIPIVLTNSPFGDLRAQITGVQSAEDLGAEITPLYYSGVARDTSVIGEWVNTKSGERKTLRIFFKGNALEYYYAEEADKTITLDPYSTLEIVVESYKKIEEGEGTMLTQKEDVKRCIVDKLHQFPTIDDAIKFGIVCAVSEISSDLRAMIVAKGTTEHLPAEIKPIDDRYLQNLNARIFPVTNQPVLEATISGSGDILDLSGYITPLWPASTNYRITDTMGTRYLPRLVTHGTGEVSVVLTKVISTDKMVITGTPDLLAEIVGVGASDLAASISGSI